MPFTRCAADVELETGRIALNLAESVLSKPDCNQYMYLRAAGTLPAA